MTDAVFEPTPSAHVDAEMSAEYPAITARYEQTPSAHVDANISSNEPGP